MNTELKFYIVLRDFCGPSIDHAPTHKHHTYEDARREAERLCKKHYCRFYVLETLSYCQPIDVKWTSFKESNLQSRCEDDGPIYPDEE